MKVLDTNQPLSIHPQVVYRIECTLPDRGDRDGSKEKLNFSSEDDMKRAHMAFQSLEKEGRSHIYPHVTQTNQLVISIGDRHFILGEEVFDSYATSGLARRIALSKLSAEDKATLGLKDEE